MPNNIEKGSGINPDGRTKFDKNLERFAFILNGYAGISLIVNCGGPARVVGALMVAGTASYVFVKGFQVGKRL